MTSTHHDFDITVVAAPESETVRHECHRNVRFVFGDPTRTQVLKNAGLEQLETLVILADRSDEEGKCSSDHRTLVTCLAAREVNPTIHLVAEVLQSGNQEHFQRIAGVEIVSIEDLTEKLLAQAVISPGITKVYLELLTATTDSNEIYIVPVPAPWKGKPFGQVATLIHAGERPTIALGYRTTPRSGHPVTVLNPQRSRTERQGVVDWWHRPLDVGDALIVMAYEAPSW